MRNKFLLCFLILPIIVPLMLCLYHAMHQGDEWRVKIAGYDPRDLLRGRYIIFRYDYGDYIQGEKVCLTGNLKSPMIKKFGQIQCDNPITVNRGQQRFYIPENIANRADRLVRGNVDDIRAGIVIRHGQPVLKNLYYKDENLLDYLKANND